MTIRNERDKPIEKQAYAGYLITALMLVFCACDVATQSSNLKRDFNHHISSRSKTDSGMEGESSVRGAKASRIIHLMTGKQFDIQVDVDLTIPGKSAISFKDVVRLRVDTQENWDIVHNTEYVSRDQRKIQRGRRCRSANKKHYLALRYGPWSLSRTLDDAAMNCLDTSFGSLDEMIEHFDDSASLYIDKKRLKSGRRKVLIKGRQSENLGPQALPTNLAAINVLSQFTESRPPLVKRYASMKEINGDLEIDPELPHFLLGIIRVRLEFIQSDKRIPMTISIQRHVQSWAGHIEPPKSIRKSPKNQRLFMEEKSLLNAITP